MPVGPASVVSAASIGALLGKADSTFKAVGGSSIVFNFIRSYIFGKTLRTVEYPSGDLYTIKVFSNSLQRLKKNIAEVQPPPYPTLFLTAADIRQISLWVSPHFTEPIKSDSDLRNVPENSWLVWSSSMEAEDLIPKRGYKLDAPIPKIDSFSSSTVPTLSKVINPMSEAQDEIISWVKTFHENHPQEFSESQYDLIIDAVLNRDEKLFTLYRNFRNDRAQLTRQVRRMVLNQSAYNENNSKV